MGQSEVKEEEDRQLYGSDLAETATGGVKRSESGLQGNDPTPCPHESSWQLITKCMCVVFPYAFISVFARDCTSAGPVSY